MIIITDPVNDLFTGPLHVFWTVYLREAVLTVLTNFDSITITKKGKYYLFIHVDVVGQCLPAAENDGPVVTAALSVSNGGTSECRPAGCMGGPLGSSTTRRWLNGSARCHCLHRQTDGGYNTPTL